MHWIRRHRRGRPPHPDVLTPAEWRVLEQVREGHRNAEIAVRLGITVPTVKSHVTSILAKTGLPDRYALTGWDGQPADVAPVERSRAFSWPLLAWIGSGGAKVVAGGVAGVTLLGAVFVTFAVLANGDAEPGQTEPIESFSLTAIADWTATNPARLEPHTVSYEWRQRAPGEWSVLEHDVPSWWLADRGARLHGMLDVRSRQSIADGDDLVLFDEVSMQYVREPLDGTSGPAPAPSRFGIGPLEEGSVDAFVEALSESTSVTRSGTAQVHGRETVVIAYEALPQPDLDGSGAAVATGRFYVEPGAMFVVRHDFQYIDSGQSGSVEVVDLEFGAVGADDIAASPPPGAEEIRDAEGCPLRSGTSGTATGFFTLPGEPEELFDVTAGSRSHGADCEVHSMSQGYLRTEHPGESGPPYLVFEQTRQDGGAVPERLRSGAPTPVGDEEGYARSDGDRHRLVWSRDGVALLLESDAFSLSELIDMAEAVEPAE